MRFRAEPDLPVTFMSRYDAIAYCKWLSEKEGITYRLPTQAEWEESRRHPELDRWHQYMATLMETDDAGQTIVDELEEAFSFGMFRP